MKKIMVFVAALAASLGSFAAVTAAPASADTVRARAIVGDSEDLEEGLLILCVTWRSNPPNCVEI